MLGWQCNPPRTLRLSVQWQEPTLFARSIKRNICYGLEAEDGVPAAEVPTQADVERAARLANIHHVIQAMPHGYDSVRARPCTGAHAAIQALENCFV